MSGALKFEQGFSFPGAFFLSKTRIYTKELTLPMAAAGVSLRRKG